jgi:3'-phosphoadenosine 5'-phosphosulfate sulfotransferase (PAPS reductase)/FAD synthetase
MTNSAYEPRNVKICTRCILPETFPGVKLNAGGLCNHCQKIKNNREAIDEDKNVCQQKFIELLERRGEHLPPGDTRRSSYDILMAYSGGKDSTYTLGLLKMKYHARVLAITFDNGFVSKTAVANIKSVTDRLGIDHIFFKPKWELLKKIFSVAADRELYSKKTLERASTICTSCMGIVKSLCLKMAIEQEIPMIGYGWSPGQAPLQSAIMKNNPSFLRMAQEAIHGPLRNVAGADIDDYFLQEKHYADAGKLPYNVHPLAWETYNEQMIMDEIGQYGWVPPDDTDSNSTNCLLNAYANDVHIKRYGFHPYVWEIANMVREGIMTREEGCIKIYAEQPEAFIRTAKEKLL